MTLTMIRGAAALRLDGLGLPGLPQRLASLSLKDNLLVPQMIVLSQTAGKKYKYFPDRELKGNWSIKIIKSQGTIIRKNWLHEYMSDHLVQSLGFKQNPNKGFDDPPPPP